MLGCGSSEKAMRPPDVAIVKGFLSELPDVHYRFQAAKEREGSGPCQGLGFWSRRHQGQARSLIPEVNLGPSLRSGVGLCIPVVAGVWRGKKATSIDIGPKPA